MTTKVRESVSLDQSQSVFGSFESSTPIPLVNRSEQEQKVEQLVRSTIARVNENLLEVKERTKIRRERTVALIGNTGVGKTVLINLIAEKRLCSVYDRNTARTIVDVENPLEGFKAGHRPSSETSIPQMWIAPNGVTFWDCPGFDENRGIEQEIANAVCMKKIFEVSPSIKILVVVKERVLTDNKCTALLKFARILDRFFLSDIEKIRSTVSLVVSHASSSFTVEHARNNIDRAIKAFQQDPKINILRALKASPIAIFMEPEKGMEGVLDATGTRNAILENLGNVQYADQVDVHISLSDHGMRTAHTCRDTLITLLREELHRFLSSFGESINRVAAPYTHLPRAVPLVQREQEEEKLCGLLRKVESLVTTSEGSLQVALVLGQCQEIAQECRVELIKEFVSKFMEKLELLRNLERCLGQSTPLPSEIILSIREKLNESLIPISSALKGIERMKSEERAERESLRAAEASRKAHEETLRAEEAERLKNASERASQAAEIRRKAESEVKARAEQQTKISNDARIAAETRKKESDEAAEESLMGKFFRYILRSVLEGMEKKDSDSESRNRTVN
jgi:hypothetical protein